MALAGAWANVWCPKQRTVLGPDCASDVLEMLSHPSRAGTASLCARTCACVCLHGTLCCDCMHKAREAARYSVHKSKVPVGKWPGQRGPVAGSTAEAGAGAA